MPRGALSLSDLKCVEWWQLEGWIRAHRIAVKLESKHQPAVAEFCGDCTAEYEAEMREVGRCIRG